MSVGANVKRGSAELAILAVLAEEPLHGYEIARRIHQTTAGNLRFQLASLYPTLYRLEKRGWILGSWQEHASARRRRSYRLTALGKKQLAPLRREWRLLFEALDRLAEVSRA